MRLPLAFDRIQRSCAISVITQAMTEWHTPRASARQRHRLRDIDVCDGATEELEDGARCIAPERTEDPAERGMLTSLVHASSEGRRGPTSIKWEGLCCPAQKNVIVHRPSSRRWDAAGPGWIAVHRVRLEANDGGRTMSARARGPKNRRRAKRFGVAHQIARIAQAWSES